MAPSRGRGEQRLDFTATELKNKTGLILEQVIAGRSVTISRHGPTDSRRLRLPMWPA